MAFIALMLFALFATDVSAQTGRLVIEKGNAKIYQYDGEWKLYHNKEVVAHGEGVLDINNLSPTFKLFLDMFAETGKDVRFNKNVNKAESATYGPLLRTAWNQSPKPYNHLFPLIIYQDQNGQTVEEHPVVGCVTVSSAQILNYFRYCQPIVVNKQYANSKHEVKQFSDYCKISNVQPYGSYWLYDCEVSYTPDFVKINSDDDELSKFMLAIAMKQGASFGKDGTGTSTYGQRDAFTEVYGYDVESYDIDQLDNNPKVANALKNGIPLIIAGGSHSFILDGYNGSEYHIDYGWGGHNNCWMTSSAFESTKYGDGNAFIQICKPKNSTIMQSAPKYLHIVTNGTDNKYDLSLVNGLSYKAEAKLAAGTHNFYFEYADGSTLAPYTQSPIAINGDNTKFRHHGHYVSSPAQITLPYGYTLEFVHNAGINEISISAKDIELTISGTVLDASGKPVANAIVTTSPAKPVEKTSGKDKESEGSGWTFTKESNTFIPEYEYLTNIEVYAFYYGNPGNLKVYVTNDNNDIIWQKSVPHTSVNTKGTSVVVDNGLKLNTNKKYTVVIEPENASTSGNLYYYQRAADKTMAYHITTCNAPYFKTGSDGKYSISVTNPFNGKLYALVDGTEFTPLSFNNATTDLTNKDFKPGTSSTVTISGKILDENSNPISPAEVSITADKSGTTVKTDADGNYNIEVSKNFTGKLYAFANGYTFEPLSLSNVAGNLVGKDLKGVSDFVTVSGFVYNATNTPVADATVSLNADKSNGVKTSANGSYSIKVSKNYTGKLYAFAEGIDFDPVALTTATKDVSGVDFKQPSDLITITGTVYDENGKPMAGVYINTSDKIPEEVVSNQVANTNNCYFQIIQDFVCPYMTIEFKPLHQNITKFQYFLVKDGDPAPCTMTLLTSSGQELWKKVYTANDAPKYSSTITEENFNITLNVNETYRITWKAEKYDDQNQFLVMKSSDVSPSKPIYTLYSLPDNAAITDADGRYSIMVKRNSNPTIYAIASGIDFEPKALSNTTSDLSGINFSGLNTYRTISGKVLDREGKGVANAYINSANEKPSPTLESQNEPSAKQWENANSASFRPKGSLLTSIDLCMTTKGNPGFITLIISDANEKPIWQKNITAEELSGSDSWKSISFGSGISVEPSALYYISAKREKGNDASNYYSFNVAENGEIAYRIYSSTLSTITDKDGNYSLPIKRGSDITLYAIVDNVNYSPLVFTNVTKDLTEQNFIAPTITLYTVSGTVVDENSEAIAGAKVSLDGKDVTTDAYGAFAFTVEEGFSGNITATAEGFTFDPVALSKVSANLTEKNLVGKVVKQTVTISGTVTDQNSTALSGVKVSVQDQTATTNAQGEYTLTVEKGFSGKITATLDGYEFEEIVVRNATADKTEDFTGTKVITSVTITGKVLDENSKGISGATVSANGKTATTDAKGVYSLVVSVGFSGKMSVTADGYEFDPVAIRNIRADKAQNFIGTKMVSFVTITGKVLDENSKGISGAQVSINETTVTTDEDGKYTIAVEKDFSGNLTASADDYAFDPIYINATTGLANQDFKGKKSVQFVTISGKVSDKQGTGIYKAKVSLTDDGAEGKTVETNYFGRYSIAVESGYTGSLYAIAGGYTFEPATLSDVTTDLTHDFAGSVEYVTYSGNVYDEDDYSNIEDADIYFKPNNGGSVISTKTDANGNYSMQIPKLVPGSVYPVVDGYTFEWECRIIGEGTTTDKTDVDFRGKKTAQQYTISGTVTDYNGDPLSSVYVTFTPSNYTLHSITEVTDDNGEYSITVSPGSTGTISAIAEGYTFANQTISIEDIDANSTDNDFRADENEVITNPIIIYGIVTDENNEPIEGATISLSRYGSGKSVKSEANGSFELPVEKFFSGRIYASAAGYRFESQSVYNVTDHITDIAFVGAKVQNTVNITIYAIDEDSYEYLEDVVIYLNSDKQGTGYTPSPDFEGDPMFTIPVEKGTPVTLYAFADRYTFEPLNIDNPSNMTNESIFGTTNGGSSTSTRTVNGWVSDNGTYQSLKGVTITIADNQTVKATTDKEGFFSIDIPSDYTGKVYATLSGYEFEPVDIDTYVFIYGTTTAKTTTVYGWAWDMATEKNLKGVVITIADNNDVTATTDYEGYFEIEIPDTYKGKLYATLEGYEFEPQDIDPEGVFFEGTTGQIVQKTFKISGTVRTEDYDVIAGAEVSLTEDKAEGKTVKTDEDGDYTIEVPENFKGKLYAFAVGYTFEPLTFSRGVFRDLTGKDFDGVKSNETVTVSGKVTDEKGKALAEAIVSYWSTTGDGESVTTGKDGSYSIKVPKNFTGKLFASFLSDDELSFEPISIENVTANITGKDFKAQKTTIVINTIIEGMVWNDELVGIAGAVVSTTPDKAEGTTVTTDERGNFIFEVEGSFTGTLYAFADGYEFEPITLKNIVGSLQNQIFIGEVVSSNKTVTISGQVTDRDFRGIAGAEVYTSNGGEAKMVLDQQNVDDSENIYMVDDSQYDENYTLSEFTPTKSKINKVEFKLWKEGKPTGTVSVAILDEEAEILWEKVLTAKDVKHDDWTAVNLDLAVTPGDTYSIGLKAGKYDEDNCFGYYNAEDEEDGMQYKIYTLTGGESKKSVTTDSDGNYVFEVENGADVTLYAFYDGLEFDPLTFTNVKRDLTDQDFFAKGAAPVEEKKFVTISGKVLDEKSQPIAGALISSDAENATLDCSLENAEGYVEFDEDDKYNETYFIPSGRYLSRVDFMLYKDKGAKADITVSILDASKHLLWSKTISSDAITSEEWTSVGLDKSLQLTPGEIYNLRLASSNPKAGVYYVTDEETDMIYRIWTSGEASVVSGADGSYTFQAELNTSGVLHAYFGDYNFNTIEYANITANATGKDFKAKTSAINPKKDDDNGNGNGNGDDNGNGNQTPVSTVEQSNAKVWSFDRNVVIETTAGSKYVIIDLNGRKIAESTTQSTHDVIAVNKTGIFVIHVNGGSYKVFIQ